MQITASKIKGLVVAAPASGSGKTTVTLGLPVLLVADAKRMARSFAALVKGFCEFDPGLQITGVIANNVAGQRHLAYLQEAMDALEALQFPLLGGLPREAAVEIPERHLGLYTADDHLLSGAAIECLAGRPGRIVPGRRLPGAVCGES